MQEWVDDSVHVLPSAEPAFSPATARWLRRGLGLSCLVGACVLVQRSAPGALFARFAHLKLEYVLLAMLIAVPQLVFLAWRWRLTSSCLGVPLSRGAAFHEYALSLLINVLAPWGMLGDALRVARRARRERAWQGALHSVLVERSIGQGVVVLWACAAAVLWLGAGALAFVAALLGTALCLAWSVRAWARQPLTAAGGVRAALHRLCVSFERALASKRVLTLHVLLSSAILLLVVAQMYCALGALGLSLPPRAAVQIFPFMLLSMTVPASLAGFGPREAATASLYRAAHLNETDGLAFALAFGALMLAAVVPWALCLLVSARFRDRGGARS
jgi:glycosyltransferase 2 family protein